MYRLFFTAGALLAGLAVAAGAATGHETSTFEATARIWLEKAIRYQFLHSLALIATALALALWPGQQTLLLVAGWSFLTGIVFFSGSLYLMAFTTLSAGYFTPFGGLCFLAGWLAMVIAGIGLTPPR
ncbi:MAG: DUF423 domain-containing protein [Desulfopila sp.]